MYVLWKNLGNRTVRRFALVTKSLSQNPIRIFFIGFSKKYEKQNYFLSLFLFFTRIGPTKISHEKLDIISSLSVTGDNKVSVHARIFSQKSLVLMKFHFCPDQIFQSKMKFKRNAKFAEALRIILNFFFTKAILSCCVFSYQNIEMMLVSLKLLTNTSVDGRWTTPVLRRFSLNFLLSLCCLPLFICVGLCRQDTTLETLKDGFKKNEKYYSSFNINYNQV